MDDRESHETYLAVAKQLAMIADAAEHRPDVTRSQIATSLRRIVGSLERRAQGLPAEAPPPDTTVVDGICDQLGQAGDAWRDALPAGAVVIHDRDPVMRDQVWLPDGTALYRAEESTTGRTWFPVGWSDASKARVYRPTGLDAAIADITSMHTDDPRED